MATTPARRVPRLVEFDRSRDVSDDSGQLTISLTTNPDSEVPLGEPVEVTLEVANAGERSLAAPVDVSIVAPDGTTIGIYRTSMFAPFGDSATESVSVTTSRWFADPGEFELRAELTDPSLGSASASLPLVVGETTRTIPKFEDVTDAGGARHRGTGAGLRSVLEWGGVD